MSERFIIKKQLSSRKSADGFLADDLHLKCEVRLRRIHSPLTPQQLTKFQDQLQVTKRQISLIKSDLVLSILDVGIDSKGAWIALPYYDNKQLLKFQSLPLPLSEFHNLATQTLSALAAIHDKNLVHGALSPNSIDIIPATTENGRNTYMIRDLGMRRLLILAQNQATLSRLPSDVAILAPELFQNQEALPESDLYMTGQLFYYLLAGGHPLVGCSAEEAEKRHLKHDYPSLHKANKNIPSNISTWIELLTQADPLKRPKSAKDALNQLPKINATSQKLSSVPATICTAPPPTKDSWKSNKLVISIIAVIILGLATFFVTRGKKTLPPSSTDTENSATAPLIITIKPYKEYSINGILRHYLGSRIGTTSRGSTSRSAIVFKISDLIDASPSDSIENVASLNDLTLSLQLTSKSPKSKITPIVHYAGYLNDYRPKNLKKEIIKVSKGDKGTKDMQQYTFRFEKIELSESSYNGYIVFFVLSEKTAAKGDSMFFDQKENSLTVEK